MVPLYIIVCQNMLEFEIQNINHDLNNQFKIMLPGNFDIVVQATKTLKRE